LAAEEKTPFQFWKLFSSLKQFPGNGSKHTFSYQNRNGDHICYISDLSKMYTHFSGWTITKDLKTTFTEVYKAWMLKKT
jgi:CDP-paratose 2-epimerase